MTRPPNDPASGGEPEDRPESRPEEPRRPGPHGEPYGGQPPPPGRPQPGWPPPGGWPQPGGPYGQGEQGRPPEQEPHRQPPHGQEQQPYGWEQQGYEQGYGGLPRYPGQGGYEGGPGHGAPGGYGHPGQVLAGRWARLGAAIVDGLLIAAVTTLIALPFVDWDRAFDSRTGDSMTYSNVQFATNAVSVLLAFLYYWLMHARWGQTLGKRLLAIRVVREEDGRAITTGQAAGRSAVYSVLGGVCGCFGLVNIAWILWDPRKQALHCKAARTVVVKAGPGVPDPYARR